MLILRSPGIGAAGWRVQGSDPAVDGSGNGDKNDEAATRKCQHAGCSRAYPLPGVGQAEPSGRWLQRSQIALHAQPQQPQQSHLSQMPPRTYLPSELPRRPPPRQQQTTHQQQPHQHTPQPPVVFAVPLSSAKYCLPSRKYCSGGICWRYCPTTTFASDSEVARYQGSRYQRPQYSTRLTATAPLEGYCAPGRNA